MDSPRTGTDRIDSLDLVRGVAICGLAPINILDFAMRGDYYMSPHDLTGPGLWIWVALAIFGMGKFYSLFSLLFGAGMVLQTQRSDLAGGGTAEKYLPRLGWLLLFGVLHAYLVWYGDVLVGYAVTGFVVFWLRGWTPRSLAWTGGLFGAAILLTFIAVTLAASRWVTPEIWDSIAAGGAGDDLSGGPWDFEDNTGTWLEQMPGRALFAFAAQLIGIPFLIFPMSGSLMLLGMALLKSGFFEGRWKRFQYGITLWGGLGIGLLLSVTAILLIMPGGWKLQNVMQHYSWMILATPFWVFGYAAALVLWSRTSLFTRLQAGFRAVGRMALSNYLGQSILFHLLFYGTGLGLEGKLEFTTVMLIPLAVWIFQMAFSSLWLRFFRFGPLEWIWRSLTYRKFV